MTAPARPSPSWCGPAADRSSPRKPAARSGVCSTTAGVDFRTELGARRGSRVSGVWLTTEEVDLRTMLGGGQGSGGSVVCSTTAGVDFRTMLGVCRGSGVSGVWLATAGVDFRTTPGVGAKRSTASDAGSIASTVVDRPVIGRRPLSDRRRGPLAGRSGRLITATVRDRPPLGASGARVGVVS